MASSQDEHDAEENNDAGPLEMLPQKLSIVRRNRDLNVLEIYLEAPLLRNAGNRVRQTTTAPIHGSDA